MRNKYMWMSEMYAIIVDVILKEIKIIHSFHVIVCRIKTPFDLNF